MPRQRISKNMSIEVEGVTELDDIKPSRIDQVGNPASGIPVLFMKSLDGTEVRKDGMGCGCCDDCVCDHGMAKDVNSVGGISEAADVDGAEQVLQLLARLIQSEAREMATGEWDEAYDIQLLIEAASIIRCFRDREEWAGYEDDGDGVQKALDTFAKDVYEDFLKASRKFSAETRRSLASEGKALEDGSYPIPDADALRRAAILARSGHGNVAAAKRLIAKRAKELGVANPLAEKTEKSVATQADGYGPGGKYEEDKTVKDPEDAPVNDGSTEPPAGIDPNGQTVLNDDEIEEDENDVTKAAITEALAPLQNELNAVKEQLAKVLSMPVPGAPAISAPPAARKTREREDLLAKAAQAERMAETITEPDLRNYYRTLAEQARADAAGIH